MHPRARAIVFTIVAGVLLSLVTGLALVVLSKSHDTDYWVTHSFEVGHELDRAQNILLDAEASERGFLLTNEPSYLASLSPRAPQFEAETSRLLRMIQDNPLQVPQVERMRQAGVERLRLLDEIVQDRRRELASSYGPALRERMDKGEQLMQRVQALINELTADEDRLLAARRQLKLRFDRIATAVILSASALLVAMGVGLVRIQRDLDRRERLEARLVTEKTERDRLIKDLERSNRDLDRFAYAASHDLKAPLRGILNLSTWIEEDLGERISTQSREHLNTLRGRVHRLELLIDGILAYSRAGQKRTRPERIDMGGLLRGVVELLEPEKKATVVVGSGMPTLVAEPVPLQQVFQNLIDNALKHGHADQPQVMVDVVDRGASWDFSVKDNGPGIAPEFHERIWGVFQTLESRDKTGGTGIGLATVRKIAESRGGAAWVESSPGQGAVFHVSWPKNAYDTGITAAFERANLQELR